MDLYADLFTQWGGNGDWKTIDEDLGNYPFSTYLELRPGVSADKVAQNITKIFHDKRAQTQRIISLQFNL